MKKILVINNDMDTMTLLKSWLEKKTYEVQFTSNRNEATKIVREFEPDLVLLDIMQKNMANELQTGNKEHHTPVLLMTGYTKRPKLDDIAVDDVIEKPFNLPLLEKKIEKLVQKVNFLKP